MKLVIGDKGLSSWSLRPWIVLKQFGIPFEEINIRLDQPETKKEIAKYSPSGKVPVLIDGDLTVWDSLAICEYLHEKLPDRRILPEDEKERAWARCLCAEMHSGFLNFRTQHPFQIARSPLSGSPLSPEVEIEVRRIKALLKDALDYSGGPYLFGDFSMADAFYTPVILGRFIPYGISTEGVLTDYVRKILAMPSLMSWVEGA